MTETLLYRYRVRYAKTEALRYTGHLDTHRAWERTVRRARLPLAYSQGFRPQPRIQQACALPLGFTSQAEIVDLWLNEWFEPAALTEKLRGSSPPGIEIEHVEPVDLTEPPLQTRVQSSEYYVELLDPLTQAEIDERISALMSSASLPREKRGKHYDLRPLILDLNSPASQNHPALTMHLTAREGATGRPEEVLSALGLDPLAARVIRTSILVE